MWRSPDRSLHASADSVNQKDKWWFRELYYYNVYYYGYWYLALIEEPGMSQPFFQIGMESQM